MKAIPEIKAKISYVLKLIVILSAATGTAMSAWAGRNSFMGGSRVFMYFTIQSNIAIAIICAAGLMVFLIAIGWVYVALAKWIGKRTD
ncbi:MAG: hypothetical protein K5707_01505 [Clostridia bacterium]|nr:hypothetical protein [Clostridia bacterium]